MDKRNEAFHIPPNGVSGEAAPAVDVERDIAEYLRAHHGVEANEITDESTLADLGLDSLSVFAIGDILQSKYGISLDDERIAGVRTYSEFKTFIFMNRGTRPKGWAT